MRGREYHRRGRGLGLKRRRGLGLRLRWWLGRSFGQFLLDVGHLDMLWFFCVASLNARRWSETFYNLQIQTTVPRKTRRVHSLLYQGLTGCCGVVAGVTSGAAFEGGLVTTSPSAWSFETELLTSDCASSTLACPGTSVGVGPSERVSKLYAERGLSSTRHHRRLGSLPRAITSKLH